MWDGEGRGHTDALQALAGQCSSIPQEAGRNHHMGHFGGRCKQVLCLALQVVLRQASRGRKARVYLGYSGFSGRTWAQFQRWVGQSWRTSGPGALWEPCPHFPISRAPEGAQELGHPGEKHFQRFPD